MIGRTAKNWNGKDPTRALFLLIPVIVYTLHALIVFPYTNDDAFISFRYAENVAADRGLVFNEGDALEGYSNFLWILFLELGIHLGVSPFLLAKLAGALLGAVNLIFLYALTRKVLHETVGAQRAFLALFPPLILAFDRGHVMWAVGGLETQAVMTLLLLGWYILGEEIDRGGGLFSVVPFLLLIFLRPEGLMYAIPVIALIGWNIMKQGADPVARTAKQPPALVNFFFWGGTLVLMWALYTTWRTNYFGDFLPNVVPAKASGGVGQAGGQEEGVANGAGELLATELGGA